MKTLGLIIMILISTTMKDEIQKFYSMEYVNIIGNRILKVWVTSEYIYAAKVKGLRACSGIKGIKN